MCDFEEKGLHSNSCSLLSCGGLERVSMLNDHFCHHRKLNGSFLYEALTAGWKISEKKKRNFFFLSKNNVQIHYKDDPSPMIVSMV